MQKPLLRNLPLLEKNKRTKPCLLLHLVKQNSQRKLRMKRRGKPSPQKKPKRSKACLVLNLGIWEGERLVLLMKKIMGEMEKMGCVPKNSARFSQEEVFSVLDVLGIFVVVVVLVGLFYILPSHYCFAFSQVIKISLRKRRRR